jgi:hypothetical protein
VPRRGRRIQVAPQLKSNESRNFTLAVATQGIAQSSIQRNSTEYVMMITSQAPSRSEVTLHAGMRPRNRKGIALWEDSRTARASIRVTDRCRFHKALMNKLF